MTEQELLNLLAGAYDSVSTPTECAQEFETIIKKIVRVAKTDSEQNPPTLEVYNLIYYVIDSGLETESAFVSPTGSNQLALSVVGSVYETAISTGTIVKKIKG